MTGTSNFTLRTSYPKSLYRSSHGADWDKHSFLRKDAISLFSYLIFLLKTVFSVVLALPHLGTFISHWLTEVIHFILSLYHTVVFPCEVGAKF